MCGATCSRRVIREQVIPAVGAPDIPLECRYPRIRGSRSTQHASYLIERLRLSLNRKRAAPVPKVKAETSSVPDVQPGRVRLAVGQDVTFGSRRTIQRRIQERELIRPGQVFSAPSAPALFRTQMLRKHLAEGLRQVLV